MYRALVLYQLRANLSTDTVSLHPFLTSTEQEGMPWPHFINGDTEAQSSASL